MTPGPHDQYQNTMNKGNTDHEPTNQPHGINSQDVTRNNDNKSILHLIIYISLTMLVFSIGLSYTESMFTSPLFTGEHCHADSNCVTLASDSE